MKKYDAIAKYYASNVNYKECEKWVKSKRIEYPTETECATRRNRNR